VLLSSRVKSPKPRHRWHHVSMPSSVLPATVRLTLADLQGQLRLALPQAPEPALQHWAARLEAEYSGAQRHYHNLEHLAECLAGLARCDAVVVDASSVRLALLFHDAIYVATASDNEAQSAALAAEALAQLGADAATIAAVTGLVLATQRHKPNGHPDCPYLLDIDLSILGAAPERFARYEAAIRAEYAHVPDDAYEVGRSRVMRQFAQRPRLYFTEFFHQVFQAQAAENLLRWR